MRARGTAAVDAGPETRRATAGTPDSQAYRVALTVYFDGQFWVGVAERTDGEHLEVCRTVFGAEPSTGQIAQFVLSRWNSLAFGVVVAASTGAPASARNPKRRQREAARAAAHPQASAKAQQALAQMREERKESGLHERAGCQRHQTRERYAQQQEKRKRKHRGH